MLRRGFSIGFLGYVISLIWSSGFGILLCESSVQVTLVRRTRKVNCILARAESEKPNQLTLERNLRLITKQRNFFFTPARFLRGCHAKKRVLNISFGIRDFPHLKLGIRDFKAKSGRDLGLKVCAGGGMPKITLGITGLHEVLGRDYGSEKPYRGPSENESLLPPGLHYRSPFASRFGKLHLNSQFSYPMLPNIPAI